MNLKKSVLGVFCAVCINLGSMSYSQSIIQMEDDATLYTQQEKGYVLKFDILATSVEMDLIKTNVANLADRLSLDIISTGNGKYNVVFTVNHQNHPEYVYKMMRSCGFKSLNFKNENLELIKVIEILKSYK